MSQKTKGGKTEATITPKQRRKYEELLGDIQIHLNLPPKTNTSAEANNCSKSKKKARLPSCKIPRGRRGRVSQTGRRQIFRALGSTIVGRDPNRHQRRGTQRYYTELVDKHVALVAKMKEGPKKEEMERFIEESVKGWEREGEETRKANLQLYQLEKTLLLSNRKEISSHA